MRKKATNKKIKLLKIKMLLLSEKINQEVLKNRETPEFLDNEINSHNANLFVLPTFWNELEKYCKEY